MHSNIYFYHIFRKSNENRTHGLIFALANCQRQTGIFMIAQKLFVQSKIKSDLCGEMQNLSVDLDAGFKTVLIVSVECLCIVWVEYIPKSLLAQSFTHIGKWIMQLAKRITPAAISNFSIFLIIYTSLVYNLCIQLYHFLCKLIGQNDKTAFLMDKNMKNISVLTMLLLNLAV